MADDDTSALAETNNLPSAESAAPLDSEPTSEVKDAKPGEGNASSETGNAGNAVDEATSGVGSKQVDNSGNGGAADEVAAGGHDSQSPDGNKKRPTEAEGEDLPTLPLKKARTAFFIFTDQRREEVKRRHPGEGIGGIAKALGQLWASLVPAEKEGYEAQAARERARVARDVRRLKEAGRWPEAGADHADGAGGPDDEALVFPFGRIRKICKLDPDVKGVSRESTLLITKATELFCAHLGKECVIMAQMQNRRKLLPEDVVEVCSMKERYMFLKPDLVDLRRAQIEEMHAKEKDGDGKDGGAKGDGGADKAEATAGEEGTLNTLDSYFGKAQT